MFDRFLIVGATLFITGWAIVFADSGSRVGGAAVYIGMAILLVFGVLVVARWLSRLTRRVS